MEELEDLVGDPRKPLPVFSDVDAWYSQLRGEIESEGDLEAALRNDRVFSQSLALSLPPSLPRRRELTDREGVSVDPWRVIEAIEKSLFSFVPSVFGWISLPLSVKSNLFESPPRPALRVGGELLTRGLQDPDFGFSIYWNDDAGTVLALFDWSEDEDGLLRLVETRGRNDEREVGMYVVLLVASYLFHRRAFLRIGDDSLEKFWTEYSLERRQGNAQRPRERAGWTVRPSIPAEEEEEEEEEEGFVAPLPFPPPPPPPPPPGLPPEEELSERRAKGRSFEMARLESRVKILAQRFAAFVEKRTDWQSDPARHEEAEGENSETLAKEKDAILRDKQRAERTMKLFGAIEGKTYSKREDAKRVVAWHKFLRSAIAEDLASGISSREKALPLVSEERTPREEGEIAWATYAL